MAITIVPIGGTANSLFQFGFGWAQARRLGVDLLIDPSQYPDPNKRQFNLGQFRIPLRLTEPKPVTVRERGMAYNQALVDSIQDGDVIMGYWQNEKYLLPVQDELRQMFLPYAPIARPELAYEMAPPDTAFIHVRRTDYLVEPARSFQGVLGMDYYNAGIELLRNKQVDKFFVMSDDIGWCKQSFIGDEYIFVESGSEAQDLFLMSCCSHALIANSSFSWMGAWLGDFKRDRLVIAPDRWFTGSSDYKEIVPERWVRL